MKTILYSKTRHPLLLLQAAGNLLEKHAHKTRFNGTLITFCIFINYAFDFASNVELSS